MMGQHEDALKRMHEKVGPSLWDYNPLRWWTNVVWATGAAPVHNFIQDKPYRENMKRRGKEPHRLSIDEDALAYLGILVDILSTWDRYSVFIDRTFTDEGDPVQSSNVLLSHSISQRKVVIKFLDTDFVREIRHELDESLVDWRQVIEARG